MFSFFGKPWYVRLLLFSMFFACCFLALFFLCQGQSRPVMIDQWVMDLFRIFSWNWAEHVSRFFSALGGELIWLWIAAVAVVLFAVQKKRELTLYFLSSNIAVATLTVVFKFFGFRARPLDDSYLAHQYSFPSGHTACTIVFFGLLIWLVPVLIKNRFWQVVVRVGSVVAMAMVPFSRIHLQWHYPTDVIGGFCLGMAVLMGMIFVYRVFSKGDTLNA